jgi:sec-independent protein translocase protein TatC
LKPDESKSISAHIDELRTRLLFSILFILICAGVAWWQYPNIYDFLTKAVPSLGVPEIKLHALKITEAFSTQMMVAIIGGIIGAFPVIIYNISMFILPGLSKKERRAVYGYLPAMIILFLAGCTFASYPIVPIARKFFLGFGTGQLQQLTSVSSYIDFSVLIVFGMGLVFLLPIVVLFITSIGLVSPKTVSKSRKVVWIGILIAAAAIAPNDGLSMIAISLPVVLLFEISLMIAHVRYKRKKKRELVSN